MAEIPHLTEADLKAIYFRNSPGWGDPNTAETTPEEGSAETPVTGSNNSDLNDTEDEDDSIFVVPNPIVERCVSVWCKTIMAELTKLACREHPAAPSVRNAAAREAGTLAYCAAMPQLSNRQAVTDFIACVVHGIAIGAIPGSRGTQLLYGAQVASSALPPRRKRH